MVWHEWEKLLVFFMLSLILMYLSEDIIWFVSLIFFGGSMLINMIFSFVSYIKDEIRNKKVKKIVEI